MTSSRIRSALPWIPQLVAAGILGMAGLSKLAGATDSIALFTLLGVEPWGRVLVGVLEGVATLLLLWPQRARIGAGLGAALMVGAIGTHLLKLGITYGGDPTLFLMACVVLGACAVTLRRRQPT